MYVHPERLLAALRNAYEWFEQTQMNFFSFEHEKIFLWSQLWKEEVSKIIITKEKHKSIDFYFFSFNAIF